MSTCARENALAAPRRPLGRAVVSTFLVLTLGAGIAALPQAAHATPAPVMVTGTFSGTLGTVSNSNFVAPDGFAYDTGDVFTGTFSFDPSNYASTFTATIDDVTTGSTFTLPAGYTNSGSAAGTSADYTVTANDALEFLTTQTPFNANLALEGPVGAVGLPDTVAFVGGFGSLSIIVPENPSSPGHVGNPLETLTVDLNIPEPLSISLFGVALAGLAGVKRRAKR